LKEGVEGGVMLIDIRLDSSAALTGEDAKMEDVECSDCGMGESSF